MVKNGYESLLDVTLQLNGGGRMPDAIKEGFKKIKYEAQEVKPEEKKDGD